MLSKTVDVFFQAILFVMFYLILTPLGILLRALGKDYLARRSDPSAASYWISRKP